MVYADLHIHTNNSDGNLTYDELIKLSKSKDNLNAIAITDHDTINKKIDGSYTFEEDLLIINGIELRVETEYQRIDLLGYGVKEKKRLIDLLKNVRLERKERGEKMVSEIEDFLDINLHYTPNKKTGRPHIAEQVSKQTDYTYSKVFEELIGNNCPCYISRNVPDFEKGLSVLKESCSIVSLAHPYRYNNTQKALELSKRLDAIELYYPYENNNSQEIKNIIDKNNLLVTGGSDAHDRDICKKGLNKEDFKKIKTRID